MHTIMFDIDGTLVDSFGFDEVCFVNAASEVLDCEIDTDWESYTHVTDKGLLLELLQRLGREQEIEKIEPLVKQRFVAGIEGHLVENGLQATPGAPEFLKLLNAREDVHLSIATGGWRESAQLKLQAAEFDLSGVPIATSNDHHIRTEIMRLAQAGANPDHPVVYFGDAEWDKLACAELGYQFVLLGDRTEHSIQIKDFKDAAHIFELLNIPL